VRRPVIGSEHEETKGWREPQHAREVAVGPFTTRSDTLCVVLGPATA
jgi:hypothetical protein